jgi:hypothetical protein
MSKGFTIPAVEDAGFLKKGGDMKNIAFVSSVKLCCFQLVMQWCDRREDKV